MTLRFSIPEYKKLKNFDRLIETTVDLLHRINKYGKKCKLRNEVIIYLVDDQLQMIEKDTCGMYQIYFYVNLTSQKSKPHLNQVKPRFCNF